MLFLQSHPHKYFTITPLPEGQYQHKMSHKYSAAWRAVRQRTGAKLPPDEGNHCGPRAAFFLSRIGLTISAPVLPLSDANVCNRPRKRLRPSS